MSDAAKEASVLLYSAGTDTFLEDVTRNPDRLFFDEGPKAATKALCESISAGAEEPNDPVGQDMIR